MAQIVNRLSAKEVEKITAAGMYADGAGLYLQVTSAGAKSWILRYSLAGRPREMGLGSLRKVSLADARSKKRECHDLLDKHIDPIEHRERERAANALSSQKDISFELAAETYMATHRRTLKNIKHAAQWTMTIEQYANPTLGKLLVRHIDTALVHRTLEPIWTAIPETAKRLRGRIEAILDWARVSGYRDQDAANPARWRGNLDKLLPRQSKVRARRHFPALPYAELPAFMQKLRQQKGVASRALEFCILNAARTGEVIFARPSEIDRDGKLWTIPGERMKGGKEHRVPLGRRALEIAGQGNAFYLFPGRNPEKPLSNMAMLALLDDMGHGDITVHGFRSTFKDWARDRTRFDNYVVEAALAHIVGDKVEAAYARSDVIEKRRKLMEAWADYCRTAPAKAGAANVVALR
jgi:integrase